MHNILTIAGTESSGGAGIHADLKTFSALGAFGVSILTAQVAQNTKGVQAILPTPLDFLEKQFYCVNDDVHFDAVKVGALVNTDIILLITKLLQDNPPSFLIVDPVMIAKGGYPLISQEAIETIRSQLLPLADIITPNLPEAAALLELPEARNFEEMIDQGQAIIELLGYKAVLMKGGHLNTDLSSDFLITPSLVKRFDAKRIKTQNWNGTGCTISAAIAALYPKYGLEEAVKLAKEYLTEALKHADQLKLGKRIGPVHHFYQWWN